MSYINWFRYFRGILFKSDFRFQCVAVIEGEYTIETFIEKKKKKKHISVYSL